MKKINIIIAFIGLFSWSCSDMLDIKPDDVKDENDAFQEIADIQSSLNSAYQAMQGAFGGTFQRYSELMGDNVIPKADSDKRQNIYNRATSGYFTADDFYSNAYVVIFRANITLEKMSLVNMPESDVKRITAECKFLRAYCNFGLVRMFAQPYGYTKDNSHYGIGLKSSSKINIVPRSTVAQVYAAIEEDLKDVASLTGTDVVYATSWAAKALLAEVALSKGDYDNAFNYANDVVENGGFQFDANSDDKWEVGGTKECIFRLSSNVGESNAGNNYGDFRSESGKNPNIRISKSLYNKAKTSNDKRAKWYEVAEQGTSTEYYAFTKYNRDWMDVPLFHLTEMKLVRAEAAVLKATPDLATAIRDVNDIKTRAYGAGFNLLPTADAATVLENARNEKMLELAGEGYRVYELKRLGATGEAPDTEIRGVPWNYVGLALQFPLSEKSDNFPLNPEAGK